MVRLIATLIILAIVLIVRLIMWLARPKVTVPTYNVGMGPHGGFGPPGGFGPRPGYGPQGGFGPQPGYGPPGPAGGGYAQGYGPPPGAGYGAPPGAGYGASPGAGGYGAPPGAGYGAPPAPQLAAQNAPGAVRMLVRQDCGFDRLSACLAQAGLQLAGPPGPAAHPGEPSSAVWQSASVQVRYAFDPGTYSRILDIMGPQAEQLRQHLQGQIG